MRLSKDFREFIESCVARDVRFLIVGGYALAAHGAPRYTKDLDVWIWLEPENAARVIGVLTDFGFAGLTVEDLLDPTSLCVQLGREPYRIDLLTAIQGVDFELCWPNRVEFAIGDLRVPVIGLDDFVANKRAAGRLKDLADAEAVLGLGSNDDAGDGGGGPGTR